MVKQTGEGGGGEGDAARGSDDGANVFDGQAAFLGIRSAGGEKAAFFADGGTVLEDVEDVVAHRMLMGWLFVFEERWEAFPR